MKLPLKFGLPLLGVLLLGMAFTEGREYLLLLVAAMAVALWSAFSLPHPGPRGRHPTLVERSLREAEAGEEDDADAQRAPAAPSERPEPEGPEGPGRRD